MGKRTLLPTLVETVGIAWAFGGGEVGGGGVVAAVDGGAGGVAGCTCGAGWQALGSTRDGIRGVSL